MEEKSSTAERKDMLELTLIPSLTSALASERVKVTIAPRVAL